MATDMDAAIMIEGPATPIGINKIHPGFMKSGFATLGFKSKISFQLDLNKLAMLPKDLTITNIQREPTESLAVDNVTHIAILHPVVSVMEETSHGGIDRFAHTRHIHQQVL
ncbi:hypothetical protein DAI22_01g201350 [Oryza sativa Japonica Group]|nr:hypothetical protein DAI22_01g201350 [Oryza sativa Japonica Group]